MYQTMRYRGEDGVRTVVVGPSGRKYFNILVMDRTAGLKVVQLPLSEQRYLSELPKGSIRALRSQLKVFRNFGKHAGMTKTAKSFLAKANKAA